jgi:hypothetical protein
MYIHPQSDLSQDNPASAQDAAAHTLPPWPTHAAMGAYRSASMNFTVDASTPVRSVVVLCPAWTGFSSVHAGSAEGVGRIHCGSATTAERRTHRRAG